MRAGAEVNTPVSKTGEQGAVPWPAATLNLIFLKIYGIINIEKIRKELLI